MKKFYILVALSFGLTAGAQTSVNLSGKWMLTDTAGVSLNKEVMLPGTLDMAGIGHPSTLPLEMGREQLRHLTRKVSFIGEAGYVKVFDVPKQMAGKPLKLTLERVLWKSRVAIDGEDIGQVQESLVAPHVFHIGKGLKAGKHTIELKIDNRKQYDISYENMAHAYTDETQTRWNGVLGEMTLEVEPSIGEIQVMADTAFIDSSAGNLKFSVDGKDVKGLRSSGRWKLPLPEGLATWDEFSPTLHELVVKAGKEQKTVKFGVRVISRKGGELRVNGRKTFLRGTLECCIFPLTGTPPTDDEGWIKVFSVAKQWGLNHLRFHSYCPPDAAFRVADSLGFYLQVELPVWSTTLTGNMKECKFMREEFDRIVVNYGNHPSLCLISCGNELQSDFKFLNELTAYMKNRDPRRLYATTSFTFEKGHGLHPEPEDEFFVTQWADNGWVRGQGVFDAEPPSFNKNFDASLPVEMSVPFISHEIGQYAVYPCFDEIKKYTGVLDPLNLKAIRQDMERKGLAGEARDWCLASGKLAALLYKEEMERALKTRRQSGFQLLGLQDFPGQSTALVGLVDAFWDNKGFVSPEEFRHACSPVVPLANFEKAVYTNDECFKAVMSVANYGPSSLKGKLLTWTLGDRGGSATIESDDNGLITVASLSVPLGFVEKASRVTLTASIEGTGWVNSWNIWVYPRLTSVEKGGVAVTRDLPEALGALEQGRDVLFSPAVESLVGLEGKFVPVFWSPVHFPKQAGTMGILCDPRNPALAGFPTDGHSDWQWWRLVKEAKTMLTDSLSVTPLVKCVDNFANNRRLALAFEARCGKGRMIMTSMDVIAKAEKYPEAAQMLASLLDYMNSSDFAPSASLSFEDLSSLISTQAGKASSDAKDIYE